MSARNIPHQTPRTNSRQSVGENLFTQLLDIGKQLLEADPELYKTAVAHLCDAVPREPSPVRRAAGAEQKGMQGDHTRRSTTTFHKYNLPGDAGKREYYQCMTCQERRTTNSFHADHQHDGQKYVVRWYCPLCDTLYAVTHRGYHIKNRHKSIDGKKRSKQASNASSENDDEDDETYNEDEDSPRQQRKRMRVEDPDDATSQNSEDASATVLANINNRPPPAPITMMPSRPIVPGQPVAPKDSEIMPKMSDILPADSNMVPVTHTVTQEALLGGTSLMPSESVFRLPGEQSSSALPSTLSSEPSKLLFTGASATLIRQQ